MNIICMSSLAALLLAFIADRERMRKRERKGLTSRPLRALLTLIWYVVGDGGALKRKR